MSTAHLKEGESVNANRETEFGSNKAAQKAVEHAGKEFSFSDNTYKFILKKTLRSKFK